MILVCPRIWLAAWWLSKIKSRPCLHGFIARVGAAEDSALSYASLLFWTAARDPRIGDLWIKVQYQVTSRQKPQVQIKSWVIGVQVQVESQVFYDFVKSSPKSSNWWLESDLSPSHVTRVHTSAKFPLFIILSQFQANECFCFEITSVSFAPPLAPSKKQKGLSDALPFTCLIKLFF